jgi:malonyl-CoA O-methyltransferase
MNVQSAYNAWASTYDTDLNRTRDLDFTATRQVLGQEQFGLVVELGCGTGKNTPFYAQVGQHVHALDFSEGMLAQARAKLALSNVYFSVADLTARWPVESEAADLVAGNLVLEHIEDLGFIFAEAGRVLATEGRFFLSELHPFRQYQGTQANFQRGAENTPIPAFVHHLSDYVSAASAGGLKLAQLNEWWHAEDAGKPPRLVTLVFEK